MTDECEHDFRRVYPSDVFRRGAGYAQHDPRTTYVLAVLCCKCGKSPIADLTEADLAERASGLETASQMRYRVHGDWPEELLITAYYDDPVQGASVEFRERKDQ